MAHKNHMKIKGRGKPDGTLTINLADDKLEVRGFGQPVTKAAAKQMATDYFNQCKAAWKIIHEIDSNSDYSALKALPEFMMLKSLIDPGNQTVSGVFGKEIILQMFAQKGCEGIRYIHGKDNDRNTIILLAVSEETSGETRPDGRAVSVPINFGTITKTDDDDIPVVGEVHEESLTISEVEELLQQEDKGFTNSTDVLFGAY